MSRLCVCLCVRACVCLEGEKARMNYKQSLPHNGPCEKTMERVPLVCIMAPPIGTNEHFIFTFMITNNLYQFTNDTLMQ